MLKKFGWFLLLSLLFSSANAEKIDIDKLLLKAKKENKFLMFFHHIPGCPYCGAMLDENFKDSNIIKEIEENFIYVDIYTADTDSVTFQGFTGNRKQFSVYIGAFAYPATIFMDSNGEVLYRSIGYRNIDEHSIEITYISSQSYKTTEFEAYKQRVEFERD